MKFSITIKKGTKTLASVEGDERPADYISHADTQKVIEVEQWLEKILGLRIHISQAG